MSSKCGEGADDTHRRCIKERTDTIERCADERDEGYDSCVEERRDRIRQCCDWWPCSWACRIVYIIISVVCIAWEWISNVVCVLWEYLKRVVCTAWFVLTKVGCVVLDAAATLDSDALTIANQVFRACETIGYPECRFNLAHGVAYLAEAPKSRQAGDAFFEALADVEEFGNLSIPMKLRNAPTKLMKDLGYGQDDGSENGLPEQLAKRRYFNK
jgi:hypothetical protein